jgi:hypothetical protein
LLAGKAAEVPDKMVKMIHRPLNLKSLAKGAKGATDGENDEHTKVAEDDKNDYHHTGWFLDIKPHHASDPPKFMMKLLRD